MRVSDILRQVRELTAILAGPEPMGRLDRAALELAAIEYPGLDAAPSLAQLDAMAAEIGARVRHSAPAGEFIDQANRHLFDELGYAGDQTHYYDPRNSCLNDVLARREGLPITLAVIYMEVARRLERPVYGVGLPGHFIVKYDDGAAVTYLDPFHGGTRLSEAECFDLARKAAGTPIVADRALLAAVTHRQILQRMINNLRAVYFSRRNFTKAVRLLDLLIAIDPHQAGDYRQRSAAHEALGNLSAARADLERYLAMTPGAEANQDAGQQLRDIRRQLAELN